MICKMGKKKLEKIDQYLKDQLVNLPRTCDFCDYFSGNTLTFAGSRPAFCLHPLHFRKEIDEDHSCNDWGNKI